MGRNLVSFNFLYFQLATSFHSDRGITISPVAEVAPHGGGHQRVARGFCKAVIEWGPAAAAARDDGMKLGSRPSLLHMYKDWVYGKNREEPDTL